MLCVELSKRGVQADVGLHVDEPLGDAQVQPGGGSAGGHQPRREGDSNHSPQAPGNLKNK